MTALAEQTINNSDLQDQVDDCLRVFEIEMYREVPGINKHRDEDKVSSCIVLASHFGLKKLTDMFNQCKPERSGFGIWIRKK